MDASGGTWTNLRSKLVSLTKFSKHEVLHLDRGNPRHEYIAGKEVTESSPATGRELRMWAGSPDSQPQPGLHPEWHGQQVQGDDSAPLLCYHETPTGQYCVQLWVPRHRKDMDLSTQVQRRTIKMIRGWSNSPTKSG